MGLFDFLKKNKKEIEEIEEATKEVEEEVNITFDEGIMSISNGSFIDASSKKNIEIFKHNLEVLEKEALERGKVDNFYLIREDDNLPRGFEWSPKTSRFEGANLSISSNIRRRLAMKEAGYRELAGMVIPPDEEKVSEALSKMDKTIGNLYLPIHYRSTKHYTVNTPLEITGDQNNVPVERDFIIFDKVDKFIESGYGYALYYKDTYGDVAHEALEISDSGVVFIREDKYDRIMQNEDIRKELEGKKVIKYRGDTALAISMLLTELGALPYRVGAMYRNYDAKTYEILEESLSKLAKENNMYYNKAHFGNNNHFSSYYDSRCSEFDDYLKLFIEFMTEKFPEQKDLFKPFVFTNDVQKFTFQGAQLQGKYVNEILDKIGVENVLEAINEFNALMKEKEMERYQEYLANKEKITPEMSEMFKETIRTIDTFYEHKELYDIDPELDEKLDKAIMAFLHDYDPNIQYEVATHINNIVRGLKYKEENIISNHIV